MRYILISLLLCIFGCMTAKQVVTMSSFGMEQGPDPSLLETYRDHAAIYLFYQHNLEHNVMSQPAGGVDWVSTELVEYRKLIIDPSETEQTLFELSTELGDVAPKLNLTVLKKSGERQRVPAPGSTQKDGHLNFKHVFAGIEKGDVLEVQYQISRNATKNPSLDFEFPLQFDIPCLKLEVSFGYPKGWGLRIKNIKENERPAYRNVDYPEYGKTLLKVSKTDIPPIPDEPFSPHFKQMALYLEGQIASLEFPGYVYTSFKSWEEMASPFQDYFERMDKGFGDSVGKQTEKITKGLTSRAEMAEQIIQFVQDEIQLDARSSSRKFKDILAEKKGDTFSILGLTQKMLEKKGISSQVLMVHSAQDGYMDPSFYSFNQFTFPALQFLVDGKTYVTFPYLKGLPMHIIPEFVQDQPALAIPNTGRAYLTQVTGPETISKFDQTIRAEIQPDGKVRLVETTQMGGVEGFSVRKRWEDCQTDAEKKDFFSDFTTLEEGEIISVDQKVSGLDDPRGPLQIELIYETDHLVTITPEEVVFQTAGLFNPTSQKKYKVRSRDRQTPIYIPFDLEIEKHIEIVFPTEWALETELGQIEETSAFGAVSSTPELNPGTLKVVQLLKLKKSYEPKETFPALINLMGTGSKLTIPTLIFARE